MTRHPRKKPPPPPIATPRPKRGPLRDLLFSPVAILLYLASIALYKYTNTDSNTDPGTSSLSTHVTPSGHSPAPNAHAAPLTNLTTSHHDFTYDTLAAQHHDSTASTTLAEQPPGIAASIPYTTTLDTTAPANSPTDELPIFTALRNSRDQPIPAEVDELAQELTKDATNDLQRAQALYNWLTDNIRYDIDVWKHITGGGQTYMNDHDPASVLARGTTVCAGYSWLFDAMATSVGLNSTFLIGDVRGYRGTPDDQLISAFKHAWNAVQIDGNWELLDATWGARQVNEPAASYRPRQSYYFTTPPNQLIFDHLPESTEWQLLADPLPDSDSFQQQPNLKPSFFQHGLRLEAPFGSTLSASSGSGGTLGVVAPPDTSIAATLITRGEGDQAKTLPVATQGELHRILVAPLPPGDYILRIYSKDNPKGEYSCSADFAIKSR